MSSPKALLPFGDETFASSIARKVAACGIPFIYLIAGSHHQQIRENLPRSLGVDVIFNMRFKEGQISSLKEGVRNLPTGSTEVLVWPVDQPLVRKETVQQLVDTFHQHRKHLTIPVREGKRGHPVIYDLVAIHTIMGLSSSHTAKEVQTTFENETSLVEVNDPGILIDIDTPEDYRDYIIGVGPSSRG
jgi:molybdenum cofactor cytidylyltransferase